jgi:hypothetical protein
MARTDPELIDASGRGWNRCCHPQRPATGRPNNDHRQVVEAKVWLARTGGTCPAASAPGNGGLACPHPPRPHHSSPLVSAVLTASGRMFRCVGYRPCMARPRSWTVPPAAPARSSRPAVRSDATHNRSPSRSGIAASAVPPKPISARVASCLRSGASAGTARLVSRSAAAVVARAATTLRPIEMPWSREVRGISDGPRASRAANVSSGAAGEATTGFSQPASRRP